jgi:hypothetical protein
MPLVVLLALAAFQSSPHCFMTLSARAAPVEARPKAPANKRAESATLNDVVIIASPSKMGTAALSPAVSLPDEAEPIAPHAAVPLNPT